MATFATAATADLVARLRKMARTGFRDCGEAADQLEAKDAHISALSSDLDRHLTTSSRLATENEALREKLAAVQPDDESGAKTALATSTAPDLERLRARDRAGGDYVARTEDTIAEQRRRLHVAEREVGHYRYLRDEATAEQLAKLPAWPRAKWDSTLDRLRDKLSAS